MLPTLKTRVNIATLDKDVDKYINKVIGVAGWVRTARISGKNLGFIKLTDGTTASDLQVVVTSNLGNFQEITTGSTGASLFVIGKVVPSRGKEQKVEIQAFSVQILGECDPTTFPLAKKAHSLEFLRSIQHLRPRARVMASSSRVRNALAFATHTFFQKRGFQYVHTPIVTDSDCEGAGEMFQVTTLIDSKTNTMTSTSTGQADYSKDFFKKPTFLTVSGQLNVEAFACALSNVYTFGPTFRAENSNTSRHLAEFWMIEPEIAFADLEENMNVAEDYLKFCLQTTIEKCQGDIEYLEDFERKIVSMDAKKGWRDFPLRQRLDHVINSEFARVTYTDAIDILKKAVESGKINFNEDNIIWGMDMGSEHEKYLCEVHYSKPTIVYNYPKNIKSFYMRLNDDKKTVAAMDVLVPGVGELIGGSQREERLDVLESMMIEKGLVPADYSWYTDLRRYGSVPHSGFGAGFGRLVNFTTGLNNIRDVIPFPRYPGHADF